PFGGDDAGCVPPARPALACSDAVAKALGTLVVGAARCHARQADARYDQVTLGHGGGFDEEGCETSVGARFTGSLEALAAPGPRGGARGARPPAGRAPPPGAPPPRPPPPPRRERAALARPREGGDLLRPPARTRARPGRRRRRARPRHEGGARLRGPGGEER